MEYHGRVRRRSVFSAESAGVPQDVASALETFRQRRASITSDADREAAAACSSALERYSLASFKAHTEHEAQLQAELELSARRQRRKAAGHGSDSASGPSTPSEADQASGAGTDESKAAPNVVPQDGFGVYRYANGAVYEGEWRGGRKHGRGIYRTSDGESYNGEWVNGKRHGQGTLTCVNGTQYEGAWESGARHGLGAIVYRGGERERDVWHRGRRTHDPRFRADARAASKYYEALLSPSSPSSGGLSVYERSLGSPEAEHVAGRPVRHGFDICRYENGAIYEGEWRDGRKHGRGIYRTPDGEYYDGEWADDKRHGQGTYMFVSGTKYVGAWERGARHGLGALVYPASGERERDIWHFGKRTYDSRFRADAAGVAKHLEDVLSRSRLPEPQ